MINLYFDAWTDANGAVFLQPLTYASWRSWRAAAEYVHHFPGRQYNVWVCTDDVYRSVALKRVARLLANDTIILTRWCLINLTVDKYIVPVNRINEFLECDNPDSKFDRM